MAKYDVYLQEVVFEDNPEEFKLRPILDLGNNTGVTLAAKITSKPPRAGYFGEYVLQQWKEAGLKKPSTIRLSKLFPLSDRKTYLGHLTPLDIHNIEKLLKGD